ncbi:hypothetical protein STIAU_3691 [Stigmatella aurantiaca DW4/3-1]|uniref:Uncharacterized protein n=2 Tax=Stigmatella aurantiaca TaxID=41 RepID=Q09CE7_STIAD|nr:hypothetical protein STIAU_3691 [Stigmatella aurantiaca DW4/3-1]
MGGEQLGWIHEEGLEQMKYFGGLVLLLYGAMAFSGWEPFTKEERGKVSGDVRRGPGGVLLWTGGFQGGK